MTEAKFLRFVCPFCGSRVSQPINHANHKNSMEKNPNGLVTYANLHSCSNGILNLLDLRVDHDLNVRSIDKFKLVNDDSMKSGMSLPIPTSVKPKSPRSLDIVHYHEVSPKMRISSEMYAFDIQFGIIPDDLALHTITSSTEDVVLQYTGGRDPNMDVWFTELVNIIEFSPPKELGILLEAFQYIFDCLPDEPTDFDIEILKTIFVSHEVYVDPVLEFEEEFYRLLVQHNIDEVIASKIHSTCSVGGTLSVLELTSITKSLIMTIYYAMLLEKHKLMSIQRPGILADPFYLQIAERA